jgi:hypothetical protein
MGDKVTIAHSTAVAGLVFPRSNVFLRAFGLFVLVTGVDLLRQG